MEARIDLDSAAEQIAHRRRTWESSGLDVGEVTWRDQSRGWPPVITAIRSEAVAPDSIGVSVRNGTQQGAIVLFTGGWADLEWWSGKSSDEPVLETPGWNDWLDVQRFGLLLDRFAAMFR